MNTLGRELASPSPPEKDQRTIRAAQRPPTPTIVPPTPSSNPVPYSSQQLSSSSSSNGIFYDAEDPDMQTKRRSMYRSPGTSSSPDLATLVRKAKERGGVVPPNLVAAQKEKRPELPPPLPTVPVSSRQPTSTRPRSSTNTTSPVPPKLSITAATYKQAKPPKDPVSPSGSDWVMTSPRSRTTSRVDCDKVCSQCPAVFDTACSTFFLRTDDEKLCQGQNERVFG